MTTAWILLVKAIAPAMGDGRIFILVQAVRTIGSGEPGLGKPLW